MQENRKNILIKYIIYGVLTGIVIRSITLIASIGFKSMPIGYTSLIELHANDTFVVFSDIFIIVFFGIIGFLVGTLISQIKKDAEKRLTENKERFDDIYGFIEKIRQGEENINMNFQGQDNELENALINLKDDLRKSQEEEDARKKEDEQRHWLSEGLAEFGAILRETSDNLQELSDRVTGKLVRYIDAQQAGFFIIDEDKDKKYIKEISSYAYNRKKFSDNTIAWGEGLMGACILEKETIFIKEVSEEYVKITSGLGKANPRCILVVPLKTEEGIIHGAIEVASFKIYEDYEIGFVEQVAESIATTITTLKNSMQTEKLLEESRQQAKELSKQEEFMRKTLDEMKELQLEAAKQSEEFVSFTNSVNHTMIRSEYSTQGILLYANTKFLSILGYESNSEVEGKHITEFISKKDRVWFDRIWDRLVSGGKHFEGDMKHQTKDGKDVWTISTYVSVRDINGNPEKILFLGIDTTSAKQQSLDFEGQINAMNFSSIKGEFYPDGRIIELNDKFLKALSFNEDEISDRAIFDFVSKDDQSFFRQIWTALKSGVPREGRIKMIDISKRELWLYGTFSVVRNMYEEIAKIIFIGFDITNQHLIELENKEQTKQLKIQEEKLQEAKVQLSKKLKESREEMKQQFREIETVKLLHDKTLEGMLDAIVTINQDNKIEFFNKAAEELWGVKRSEVINKDISVLLPAEHAEMGDDYLGFFFKADLDNVLLNSRKEVFIMDKNDEQVFVLMTLSEAGIGLRYNLTAFIQRIEVELF